MCGYKNSRNKQILKEIMENVKYNLDDFEWGDAYTAWGTAYYNGAKHDVYVSYWAMDSVSWQEDVANGVYDNLYGIRNEYGAVVAYRISDDPTLNISGA